jgi:hypothetical protein
MIKNETLIITFANIQYKKVVENWIIAIKKLNITNYTVISLDQELYTLLKKNDIPTVFRPCDLSLNKLWVHRVNVILEFLKEGYDILHSDADAVWIKNPMKKNIYNNNCDLIFSQGTSWPLEVHKEWKFVLCCGFFFIKSNSQTIKFVEEWFNNVKVDQDDQRSLNKLLLSKKLIWNIANIKQYHLTYNGVLFNCYEDTIFGINKDMKVALLPHNKFQRLYEKDYKAYVLHPLSEKKAISIIEILKETNCLFIEKENILKG